MSVAANIPDRHAKFLPRLSRSPEWTEVYTRSKERIDKGALLVFLGSRGTGKTQMGVCFAQYCAINLDKPALYTKAFEIFLKVRSKESSEEKAITHFTKPFLLVIDAFEVRGDTPFENRMLDLILDKRYDGLKSTVILSNDTPGTINRYLGPSICDRIAETGGICEFTWESFRR
jgi:DNA replication protein DnaC